jgi:YD repeat-containing protein
VTSLWAPNFDTYGFDYDDAGQLTAVHYPNGIAQTLSWNADGSLNQVSHKKAIFAHSLEKVKISNS